MLAGRPRKVALWSEFARRAELAAFPILIAGAVCLLWRSGAPIHAQNPEPPPEASTNARPARSGPIRIVVRAEAMGATGAGTNPFSVCRIDKPSEDYAPWGARCSLDGTRLAADSNEEALPVYAARQPDGVSVCVVNHSTEKVEFQLKAALGRGPFTVDRIGFSLKPRQPESSPEDPNSVETSASSERLTGVVTAGSPIVKPGWLEPGCGAVYLFTNRCAQVDRAYRSSRAQLVSLRSSKPSAAARILVPFRECESYIAVLSRGVPPARRYDSLRYIHRALLTLAHAQSLAENARREGKVSRESGLALTASLGRLDEALNELNALCLDLVPGVVVAPASPGSVSRDVTISLANRGRKTVQFVKIGITPSVGCRVTPDAQATFNALNPGETIRARFMVAPARSARDSSKPACAQDFTADFAYLTAKAPAHLRLRSL